MFQCLTDSTWADGNLAEAAGQLGKMVELRNQCQPNPGLSSLRTHCRQCDETNEACSVSTTGGSG